MASFCRQALTMSSRSITSKSRSSLQKSLDERRISALLCSTSRSTPRPSSSRVLSVLGSVESLMPLHSAIASARLKSNIAFDTRCWSWLSQGMAVPL
ncbi:protein NONRESPONDING TO OXYLIPINS 2, mitochondrial isoform X2 [Rhodamnia argentea]|uniref:Protein NONRESPONDING TO OXYLIPINS 2, mitochondrial isoform X2 n=1 Tax=Rhodamnia argentea TaxID=178133 RepID=A0A8B8NL71_9MYRT|nr:protein NONRESPONDING TO OXYLIPINS 2, mitochondrial isoform X2 [Rhodamnia argentea]